MTCIWTKVREARTSEVGEQRLISLALRHDVTLAIDVEYRTRILALHRASWRTKEASRVSLVGAVVE